jgi:hypothetical protein
MIRFSIKDGGGNIYLNPEDMVAIRERSEYEEYHTLIYLRGIPEPFQVMEDINYVKDRIREYWERKRPQ